MCGISNARSLWKLWKKPKNLCVSEHPKNKKKILLNLCSTTAGNLVPNSNSYGTKYLSSKLAFLKTQSKLEHKTFVLFRYWLGSPTAEVSRKSNYGRMGKERIFHIVPSGEDFSTSIRVLCNLLIESYWYSNQCST